MPDTICSKSIRTYTIQDRNIQVRYKVASAMIFALDLHTYIHTYIHTVDKMR
jgi:hypothetical protein